MARARTIKPAFFKNELLGECSMAARLLFTALWTLADREGRLEDRPKRIKADAFPYDDVDCNSLLDELVKKNFIARYEIDENKYIQVLTFTEHQKPHQNEQPSVIPEMQSTTKVTSACDQGNGSSGLIPYTLTLNPISGVDTAQDAATPQAEIKPEKKKGTRLPEGWILPDDWGDWAMSYCAGKGLNDPKPFVIEQGAVFKNYWIAKTGKDATKLDWKGTWENWIRRGLPDYQLKLKRMQREASYEQIRGKR